MTYGTGQRIAFAGLVIGFLLCTIGAIAPFWQQGSLTANQIAAIFKEAIPFIGDVKLFSMYGGLWFYCAKVFTGETRCQVYDLEHDQAGADWAIRIACVVNVLLTLLCALVALCRTCCCTGGKTICHGIIAFFAGAAGITAVGIFSKTASDGFAMQLQLMNYGWAFYIYIVGSAIVIFVSFMLCFASPHNPFTPVIISSVHHMLPNSRYTRMSDERVLIEGARDNAPNSHANSQPYATYPQVQNY